MASELRVNTINSRSGLGTITVSDTGAVFTGITTIGSVTVDGGTVTGNLTGTASTATASATAYGLSGSPTLTGITSVSTTNLTVNGNAYPSSGPLSNRNLIINGAMQVAQRATQVTGVTDGGYRTCDRWALTLNTLGTWTVDQSTDSPDGYSNSFKVTCTTADASPAAGDFALVETRLEGQNVQHFDYGTSGAKSVTLSFWVKSNKTGTASFEAYQVDASPARQVSKPYTINAANTWEYKTITLPADTAGTIDNDNTVGFSVIFWINSGSTFTGGTHQTTWGGVTNADRNAENLGVGGAVNDYFQITGVQLEVGSVATPFEHRNFGDELARCQRYYQKSYDYGTAPGSSVSQGTIMHGYTGMPASNYTARFGAQFRTSMRSQATIVTYDSVGNSGKCNYPDTSTNQSFTVIHRGENNFSAETSSLSNGTDARLYFHYTAEAEL